MHVQDRQWMELALREAAEAALHSEVPVGCVIVLNQQIIGRAHNLRETLADPTAHAEILALQQAAKNIGQWRLSGASVYVTLEPCPMCTGALINARIDRLVFGCSDPKAGCCGTLHQLAQDAGFNHQFDITSGVCAEESAALLRSFFRARRKKKPKTS
ncbi:MAG: nucleoside deaminase [Myxococcales bacterium]|nr:nucleoside deaminase [Myxococcales bacterium]